MVEITASEQNIEKRIIIKKKNTAYETSGITLNAPTFAFQGSQMGKGERKDQRKYLKT